jgi:hypothetical protein
VCAVFKFNTAILNWFFPQESAASNPDLQDDASRNLHMVTIWRDLQYQLIYHVFQREAKRQGKELVLYGGMGFVDVSVMIGTVASVLNSGVTVSVFIAGRVSKEEPHPRWVQANIRKPPQILFHGWSGKLQIYFKEIPWKHNNS